MKIVVNSTILTFLEPSPASRAKEVPLEMSWNEKQNITQCTHELSSLNTDIIEVQW